MGLGLLTQFLEDVTGKRFYADSEKHNEQFVGRVPMPEREFEQELRDLGFERNPLAEWKHPFSEPDNYEEASFRKVDWSDYPQMQLHAILYDGFNMSVGEDGYTYVYAHWEYRWDIDAWKHFRRSHYSGPIGVRKMKSLLDEAGIGYEAIRP